MLGRIFMKIRRHIVDTVNAVGSRVDVKEGQRGRGDYQESHLRWESLFNLLSCVEVKDRLIASKVKVTMVSQVGYHVIRLRLGDHQLDQGERSSPP